MRWMKASRMANQPEYVSGALARWYKTLHAISKANQPDLVIIGDGAECQDGG